MANAHGAFNPPTDSLYKFQFAAAAKMANEVVNVHDERS
jgi:hypothetical protein